MNPDLTPLIANLLVEEGDKTRGYDDANDNVLTKGYTIVGTPAVGAQVTTNITLGTAVNIAKSLISIDYGSTTAAVASSPTRASLTSTTNLQLITDAQIGGVADSMTLNWQVLTWN